MDSSNLWLKTESAHATVLYLIELYDPTAESVLTLTSKHRLPAY